MQKFNLPNAKEATEEVVTSAKQVIQNLRAGGSTHIIGALLVSLHMVNKSKAEWKNHQPIIVFLTDGEPNAGCANTDEITDIVSKKNHSVLTIIKPALHLARGSCSFALSSPIFVDFLQYANAQNVRDVTAATSCRLYRSTLLSLL